MREVNKEEVDLDLTLLQRLHSPLKEDSKASCIWADCCIVFLQNVWKDLSF